MGLFDAFRRSRPTGGVTSDNPMQRARMLPAGITGMDECRIAAHAAEGGKGLINAIVWLTMGHAFRAAARVMAQPELRGLKLNPDVVLFELCAMLLGGAGHTIEDAEDDERARLEEIHGFVSQLVGSLFEKFAGFEHADRRMLTAPIPFKCDGAWAMSKLQDALLKDVGLTAPALRSAPSPKDVPPDTEWLVRAALETALGPDYVSDYVIRATGFFSRVPPAAD